MAGWNGSGTFSRTYGWVDDQANGIKITAVRHDQNDVDFVGGINNCIAKDGQNAATANLPMGTFRHTNVGAATALTHYLQAAQHISNALIYYTASGTNTYAITPSPAISAYAAGQEFLVLFTNSNTGAATLNVNAVGAVAIQDQNGNALAAGAIGAGAIVRCAYDGTNFQINPTVLPTTSIQDSAVTLAKMDNIDGTTNAKLVGRTTASDGVPELVDMLDEDTMSSDSATAVATQQSIKSYVDTRVSHTIQYLTSGTSATYTTPTNCQKLIIKQIGGGGGGGGNGTSGSGAGGAGGTTIFNSIQAAGGSGGANTNNAGGGNAGTGGTGGTGSADLRLDGGNGEAGIYVNAAYVSTAGGAGGAGAFGGSGGNSSSGKTNTGGGGSGAAATGTATGNGGGGGAGEYVVHSISSPSASYTYTVGAAGTAGTAGTGGASGFAGGSGLIIVEEYY